MIEYKVKVYANGDKRWYLNDKRHREDGPAVEYADGTKLWYLNDKIVTEEQVMYPSPVKEYTMTELETLLGHKIKIINSAAV